MTWSYVNAALTLVLVFLSIRAWNLGRSKQRAEDRYRDAEAKVMALLVELARKGLR